MNIYTRSTDPQPLVAGFHTFDRCMKDEDGKPLKELSVAIAISRGIEMISDSVEIASLIDNATNTGRKTKGRYIASKFVRDNWVVSTQHAKNMKLICRKLDERSINQISARHYNDEYVTNITFTTENYDVIVIPSFKIRNPSFGEKCCASRLWQERGKDVVIVIREEYSGKMRVFDDCFDLELAAVASLAGALARRLLRVKNRKTLSRATLRRRRERSPEVRLNADPRDVANVNIFDELQ